MPQKRFVGRRFAIPRDTLHQGKLKRNKIIDSARKKIYPSGMTAETWRKKAWSPRTLHVYRLYFQAFERWCKDQVETAMPASPATVARYVSERAYAGERHSTLVGRVSAIGHAHQEREQPSPARDEWLREVLKGIRRSQAAQPPRQVAGLSGEHLDRIRETSLDSHSGNLTVAICSVMRDGLLRISEASELRWSDIQRDPDTGTGTLIIRRRKNDPFGNGSVMPLSRGSLDDLDRLRQWGIGPKRRVFPIHPSSIARRITTVAKRAGLEGRFSGHSPRVGMAQDLYRDGFTLLEIQLAGGWKNPSMVAYYCRNQVAQESAVARFHRRKER